MSIRVKTLSQEIKDTATLYKGEVSRAVAGATAVNYADSTESVSIFHDATELCRPEKINEQGSFCRSGYISLELPVLNIYLAGDKLGMIRKILTPLFEEEQISVERLLRGGVFYDKAEDKLIDLSDSKAKRIVYDRGKHLVGAEYIKSKLEQLDVLDAISRMLATSVWRVFKDMQLESVEINQEQRGFWLVAGFYAEIKTNVNVVLDVKAFEERYKGTRQALLEKNDSRLSLLLSLLRYGKDSVINQVMYRIAVLPIGYRPTGDMERVNPYTNVYNEIIRSNNELQKLVKYASCTLENVQQGYAKVFDWVRELMVSNAKHIGRGDSKYKPLAELLVGKTGLIRERMLGVRVDYSGRTVIIVDPELPVDVVGIPRTMIAKLLELKVIRAVNRDPLGKVSMLKQRASKEIEERACQMMDGDYEVIGRQPTLFYLGLRAFKVRPVSGDAIVLNPLSTPAFNADFDGDQMHTEIALSEEAQEEVRRLMASTSNLFYSRNGDCHVEPRQEILHGLWLATSVEPNEDSGVYKINECSEDYRKVYEKVCAQEYNIYDKIVIRDTNSDTTAGKIAFRYAIGYSTYGRCHIGTWPLQVGHLNEGVLRKDWCAKVFGDAAKKDIWLFTTIVNQCVRLGFAVVDVFPPDMTVLRYDDLVDVIQAFDDKIRAREEYYNLGFETEEAFTAYYNSAYAQLESEVNRQLKKKLDLSCGYYAMSESGARGSMDNIRQLFGMKGRVKKNENEAFNAILKNSAVSQLSGLEHAVTAYGSRQGLIEKTIETYEPGYLYRQMSHTASLQVIREEDCGDTEGLLLDYDMLAQFIPHEKFVNAAEADNETVCKLIEKILVGRYVVGRKEIIKDVDEAREVYRQQCAEVRDRRLVKKEGIRLRSMLTCKCAGCVKCYGVDLATCKMVVRGTPVGLLAAQSIGEPGTQLTMKNFQSGGIAGTSNLTSAFTMLDKYMNLYDLGPSVASKPIDYDYISPVEGAIRTVSMGNRSARLYVDGKTEDGKIKNKLRVKVYVHEGVRLKKYVKAGESIQEVQGDLNMGEVLALRGADYAQKYLTLKLYSIFANNKVDVNMKHFETLVAGMTYYICYKGNAYFREGGQYTIVEYRLHDTEGCIFTKTLHGTKQSPSFREDAVSAVLMEEVRDVMSHSVLRKGGDSMTDPFVRIALGLNLGMGSDVEGYMENRGKIDVQ